MLFIILIILINRDRLKISSNACCIWQKKHKMKSTLRVSTEKELQMKTLITLAMLTVTLPAFAAEPDLLPVKQVSLELASDIAMASVQACRKQGYNVSAVVLDRAGNVQAALRDTLSPRHTLEIAERKAGMAVMSGSDTGEFRDARADIRPELNHIRGLIVMEGGLPIRAAGSLVGAVGVSGAPGGDKDKSCAAAALKKVEERLEFAM